MIFSETKMNFEYSDKVKALQARLLAFMDQKAVDALAAALAR